MSDKPHPWSDELQTFLETHPTLADIERDYESLPESVGLELYRFLTVHEILADAVRDGYLIRLTP
jgi:hypothetical protein